MKVIPALQIEMQKRIKQFQPNHYFTKQQEDAAEGYINILSHLSGNEDALFLRGTFTNTKVNQATCLRCQKISGFHEQEYVTKLDTIKCNSSDTVGISDLIWNEFFGKYTLNDKPI